MQHNVSRAVILSLGLNKCFQYFSSLVKFKFIYYKTLFRNWRSLINLFVKRINFVELIHKIQWYRFWNET